MYNTENWSVIFLISIIISVVCSAPPYETQKAANTGGPDAGLTFTELKNYSTTGYLGVVSNPIGHYHSYFSELANGTCGSRQTTSDQSTLRKCTLATNASPFSFINPTCIGFLVSDGKIINLDPGTTGWRYFGLTKGGYFIIGDLTTDDVKLLDFDQLFIGFDWLVRNGTQMVTVPGGEIAPRTMIGTNEKGELLIFEVDGIETTKVGLTLYQAAEWAKAIGGYNMLNLDGGGSSATVYEGKIVDKPTCQDTPTPICERPVTTITCIK